MNLTVIPAEQLNTGQRKAFEAALLEYQKSMEYSADFSAGRHSLGNMYSNLGQLEKAEENYKMMPSILQKLILQCCIITWVKMTKQSCCFARL
jgi:tetratricopeptide (TPR) repeat protein